ncbi:antibiotic biosynthesis monooxygenase [Psychrobacillus sp. FSL H8-0483]|uniref:antibiotic biosynthesis monooxygenase family protein n=1 Tax=Psychrobacillus sp. FSL H8-0483 TaxID=2921389 RepID=UPI00315A9542
MIVNEGTSQLFADRFHGEGLIEKQSGFVKLEVLVKKVRRGEEEVLVVVAWESEQDWKNWEKSPDHIIESSGGLYELKVSK